jgi:hypothetical protein
MTSTNRNGNSPATLSEKGLLTPGNCVLALIDYQPQMIFGVANMDRQLLINNAVGLAKSAVLSVGQPRLIWWPHCPMYRRLNARR